MRIEDSYLIRSKWSYLVDIEGFAMKYYIKPSATVVDVSDPKQMKSDILRKILIECMSKGRWLAFDFGKSEPTKLMQVIDPVLFPI